MPRRSNDEEVDLLEEEERALQVRRERVAFESVSMIQAEVRRNSDDILVIKTKLAIYGLMFGAIGGVIGSVISGVLIWVLKK